MLFWKEEQNVCIIPAGITIEALDKGIKHVKSYEERPQNNIDIVMELKLLTLNMFYILFY